MTEELLISGSCSGVWHPPTVPITNDNGTQTVSIYYSFYIFFSLPLLQQTDLEAEQSSAQQGTTTTPNSVGPKRLHVSNIPFRFREADLKSLLGVSVCYRTVSNETHFKHILNTFYDTFDQTHTIFVSA